MTPEREKMLIPTTVIIIYKAGHGYAQTPDGRVAAVDADFAMMTTGELSEFTPESD